jgi:hypothetical protein
MYNTLTFDEAEYDTHGQEIQIFSQFLSQTNAYQ